LLAETGCESSTDEDLETTLKALYYAVERIGVLEGVASQVKPMAARVGGAYDDFLNAYRRFAIAEEGMPLADFRKVLDRFVSACEMQLALEFSAGQIAPPENEVTDMLDGLGIDINLALCNSSKEGFIQDLKGLQVRVEELRSHLLDCGKALRLHSGERPAGNGLTYESDGDDGFDIYNGSFCVGRAFHENAARRMCGLPECENSDSK
jgi:hypothetical protein